MVVAHLARAAALRLERGGERALVGARSLDVTKGTVAPRGDQPPRMITIPLPVRVEVRLDGLLPPLNEPPPPPA